MHEMWGRSAEVSTVFERIEELAAQERDELGGRHRSRERCALASPLRAEAVVTFRFTCSVQRLPRIVCDGIVGHVLRTDASAERGEAIGEAPRRTTGDRARHHRVV